MSAQSSIGDTNPSFRLGSLGFLVCLQVEGPNQDLHSGVYGGTVIEPMTDLIGILGESVIKYWLHNTAQHIAMNLC